jgi:hypothetical protein
MKNNTVSVIKARRRMWVGIYREAKKSGRPHAEIVNARHKALHYCKYVKNWEAIS